MTERKLGVVMDPIGSIKPYKDTTLALLLEAQRRGCALHYFELGDLYLRDGAALGRSRRLSVRDDKQDWYTLGEEQVLPLGELDLILMRKDPPFNTEYIYATYLLERAEAAGARVVNKPQSLRDANEKAYAQFFPQCCAPTLIASDMPALRRFAREQGEIVLKPLDGMGGVSVFRLRADDPNLSVVLETLTVNGTRYAMAQRYLPAIAQGDKRILLIDGEPVPYALARIPQPGETRGNLAAGGRGEGRELTERDRWICAQVGPALREKGLLFVGLDVIGDYLTEINVTSPTCLRELDQLYGLNIAGIFFDALEK
ncbi:MAG: glutathione synthase [Nevskiales bacterium]